MFYCECEVDWTDGTGTCQDCNRPRQPERIEKSQLEADLANRKATLAERLTAHTRATEARRIAALSEDTAADAERQATEATGVIEAQDQYTRTVDGWKREGEVEG